MTAPTLHVFSNRAALVRELTDACLHVLKEAIELRGQTHLALSGGSTPEPIYRALAERDVPWSRVVLALVDERWVAPDNEASNERLVRRCFAGPLADGASFSPMMETGAPLAAAVGDVERDYRPLRPFDLVVLGMGADGHTASWFPRAEGLGQALDPKDGATVAAVRAVGSAVAGAYVERMTLTRPAIAEAYQSLLVITGADKRATFERAAEPGPEEDMPVRALWRDGAARPLVFWSP